MPIYGNSYNKRNLEYYRKFYTLFPNAEIVNTRVHNLEWSHIRRVLFVSNPEARLWYLENASSNMWSVRELDRNISTQYFERRLAAQLPRTTIRLKTKVCCPLTAEGPASKTCSNLRLNTITQSNNHIEIIMIDVSFHFTIPFLSN